MSAEPEQVPQISFRPVIDPDNSLGFAALEMETTTVTDCAPATDAATGISQQAIDLADFRKDLAQLRMAWILWPAKRALRSPVVKNNALLLPVL